MCITEMTEVLIDHRFFRFEFWDDPQFDKKKKRKILKVTAQHSVQFPTVQYGSKSLFYINNAKKHKASLSLTSETVSKTRETQYIV